MTIFREGWGEALTQVGQLRDAVNRLSDAVQRASQTGTIQSAYAINQIEAIERAADFLGDLVRTDAADRWRFEAKRTAGMAK